MKNWVNFKTLVYEITVMRRFPSHFLHFILVESSFESPCGVGAESYCCIDYFGVLREGFGRIG